MKLTKKLMRKTDGLLVGKDYVSDGHWLAHKSLIDPSTPVFGLDSSTLCSLYGVDTADVGNPQYDTGVQEMIAKEAYVKAYRTPWTYDGGKINCSVFRAEDELGRFVVVLDQDFVEAFGVDECWATRSWDPVTDNPNGFGLLWAVMPVKTPDLDQLEFDLLTSDNPFALRL